MINLYEELYAVVSTLELDGTDYGVCGSLAMAIHGFVRATRDIDLLILREDLDRVLAAVRRCGFNLDGVLPIVASERFPVDVFRVAKGIGTNLVTLDLLIANPLLQSAWDARESVKWRGQLLQVVSSAGLYVMKTIAGRVQDLADLERMELRPDDSTSENAAP